MSRGLLQSMPAGSSPLKPLPSVLFRILEEAFSNVYVFREDFRPAAI